MYSVGLDVSVSQLYNSSFYILDSFIFVTCSINSLRNYSLNNFDDNKIDQILFGSLLGDGKLELPSRGLNARFGFIQSIIHEEYFKYFFDIFKDLNLCSDNYTTYSYLDSRTNKVYTSLRFVTYALPLFSDMYKKWYINNIKIIPFEFNHLLTPLAITHWIMQDGSFGTSGGIYLCTDFFTSEEVIKLADHLKTKYNIFCTTPKSPGSLGKKGHIRIYILKKSVPQVIVLVLPYMIPSMLYKLGIN